MTFTFVNLRNACQQRIYLSHDHPGHGCGPVNNKGIVLVPPSACPVPAIVLKHRIFILHSKLQFSIPWKLLFKAVYRLLLLMIFFPCRELTMLSFMWAMPSRLPIIT